ncbi:MAG: GWxTD domain-containing protein [Saprospiraceae bacterium]|nr:GWxTD domain-containing protein [Saprospiraceae bacterium]
MKKLHTLLFALFFLGQSAWAIDASISYANFKSADQSYIEVYTHIFGGTVKFQQQPDSTLQAQVEVVILFKQGEEVIKFDKFNLISPSTQQAIDFIDLKRFGLPEGTYRLIVAITDLNDQSNAKEYNTEITIDFPEEGLIQSDIQLLSSFKKAETSGDFVKNGVYMEPLAYNFYNRHRSALSFYNELYGADTIVGSDFLVSYRIDQLNNDESKTILIGHKRQKPLAVNPLLIQMDISELPSGNYSLVVEARDRNQKLLSQKSIFFQRSNPMLNQESIELANVNLDEEFVSKLSPKQLEYSLRALTPKLPQADVSMVDYMMKKDSIDGMRLYLYSYWVKENPNNPEFAYKKYIEVANAIDKKFKSGFRYGFETDRGFIYMKYGQPDDIERRDVEPSSPPYEVWVYYDFPQTRQSNVKFIFYNPSLAPGDFQLLHSTAIGELSNPQWQLQLYRNDPNGINGDPVDGTQMRDGFNRQARDVFRDY